MLLLLLLLLLQFYDDDYFLTMALRGARFQLTKFLLLHLLKLPLVNNSY